MRRDSEGTHSDYRKKGGDSSLTLRRCPEPKRRNSLIEKTVWWKEGILRLLTQPQNDKKRRLRMKNKMLRMTPLLVTLRRSRRVSWGDSSVANAPSEWQLWDEILPLRFAQGQNDKKKENDKKGGSDAVLSEVKEWLLFCHHDPEPKPWAYAKGQRRVTK